MGMPAANRRLQVSRLILMTSFLALFAAHALPLMKLHNFSTTPPPYRGAHPIIEHTRWTWEDDIVPFRMLANFFASGLKMPDLPALFQYTTLLCYNIFIIATFLTAGGIARHRVMLWTIRITSLMGATLTAWMVIHQSKHPDPSISLLAGYWLVMASVWMNSLGLLLLPGSSAGFTE